MFDRRFQWDAAFYREDWNDAQIQFFDPGVVGNVTYLTNGQNFRINGTETSLAAELWHGLRLQAIGAWNSSTQLNSPSLVDNNPQSVNFGKPITQVCASGPTSCVSASQPLRSPRLTDGRLATDPLYFVPELRLSGFRCLSGAH